MIETIEIIKQLLLGGLLGIAGQGLRIVVGLKKLNDEASVKQESLSNLIVPSRMLTSLLIGFCAGVLAIATMTTFKTDFFQTKTRETILGLIAAGYSGTDFIEGLIRKYLPK